MSIERKYQQTLDYLYSFVDFSLSRMDRNAASKFNLERMVRLMASLDDPQEKFAIIHVAGTKGKGSVSALCSSALQAGGYRVGLYTSPHLHDYNERIKVNDQPIPHADLVSFVEKLKPHIESIPELTTFEITTALALTYFGDKDVDVAVLEVGLGGRLDATNVVTPEVSVITSLSYDHTQILGNTLSEIAAEKAGIIKIGVPVVLAPQKDEARMVIEEIARERSAPLTIVGADYLFAPGQHSLEEQTVLVWPSKDQDLADEYFDSGDGEGWRPVTLKVPLLGYHQIENAATAYTALQILQEQGLPMSQVAIGKGFSQVFWPGRFEILQQKPPVVIDSAHNRDSAQKLRVTLDDYFPGMNVILVFGASEDKDVYGMFAELMPRVDQVVATKSFHPRAMDPQEIVEVAHQFGKSVVVVDDVADALMEALRVAKDGSMVLASGSIFVAAGAREAWHARKD
jgi:dihydrofolate synthase/folylpolyglutamate synthase